MRTFSGISPASPARCGRCGLTVRTMLDSEIDRARVDAEQIELDMEAVTSRPASIAPSVAGCRWRPTPAG